MIGFRRVARAAIFMSALLLMGGCSWIPGGGNRDVPEMHKKLSRTFDIQTGVVEGDLDRAKRAASWLVNREDGMVFPPEARPYQREFLGYASMAARAQDLEAVASQTGYMAAACGDCHIAMETGPRFVVGSTHPEGDSREAQMIRHLWAADRMWEGLVGPSESSWRAGASALAETGPALVTALRTSTLPARSPSSLAEEVVSVARDAMTAATTEARAQVYGRVLTTCNGCHKAIGIMVQSEGS